MKPYKNPEAVPDVIEAARYISFLFSTGKSATSFFQAILRLRWKLRVLDGKGPQHFLGEEEFHDTNVD